jgi:hypothetical protein
MRTMEQTEMLRWGSRVDTHFHTLRPINVEFALIDNMIPIAWPVLQRDVR